jgi:hypothetical protein
MHVLQIEHPVPDFDGWKRAFDSDPIGRERSGVRRYRVLRPVDNPKYAMIDLEFDNAPDAEACLAALKKLWPKVEERIMENPRARIVEVVERKEY